jgi:hypothetical protein
VAARGQGGRPRWIAPVVIVVAGLIGLGLAKNLVAQAAISGGVKLMTGLTLDIGAMDVGVFKSAVGLRRLTLRNPAGFQERVMVDLPEVYVDYDLGAFLRRRVHLEQVRLHLKEFIVVRNAAGKLNVDALKPVQESTARGGTGAAKPTAQAPQIQIDRLKLQIGTVVYKDYSKGTTPTVQEYALNLDEEYRNITNPTMLAGLIVTRALMSTAVGRLAGVDLGPLQQQVGQQVGRATQELQGAASQLATGAQEAASSLKKLIGFGGN